MRLLRRSLVFVVLTLITQIGGIVYLLCHVLVTALRRRSPAFFWVLFGVLYVGATAFAVPPAARIFGRAPLGCEMPWEASRSGLAVLPHACLLNRHYLRIATVQRLEEINSQFAASHAGSRFTVLETGFPFLDGFPLLPHLSHNDGNKVDLAYFYRDRKENAPIGSGSPSPIGFFVTETPRAGDVLPCADRFTPLRWSFWWFRDGERNWVLDEARTADLVKLLAGSSSVERILLEPHLVARLNVADPKVRFQGCQAARHDDHIHVSFR